MGTLETRGSGCVGLQVESFGLGRGVVVACVDKSRC